jgi:hypothetical protein
MEALVMTEYHPPMTGLETHFEEEIASEAHRTPGEMIPDALQKQMRAERESQQRTQDACSHETQADHVAEDAMQLGM